MEGKAYFSQKLSNILFLDIKRERLISLFKVYLSEDVYMPIKSTTLINNIKEGESLDEIPIFLFIEGMYYVLGIDEGFKYAYFYRDMLKNMSESIPFIKNVIFNEVKKENFADSYIFLKGLVQIEENAENYEKLLSIGDIIRTKDKDFKDEMMYIIEKAKIIEDNPHPYLYEAIIKRGEEKYESALFSINKYIEKGGKNTPEVSEFIHSLKNINAYERGKELLYEDADKALKILIPLLEEYGDNASLYYHIAVGYRILENYEKAIYYLNEALAIDSDLVEVVNELGINYASLEDYENAIKYLRKAFDVTRSVEICTNLIMCYLNLGDINQAKNHLEIAKKLDDKDEVVVEFDKFINKK